MNFLRPLRGPFRVVAVLDAMVGGWIAERSRADVIDAFTRAEAAIAPVYTAADIHDEEQFHAIGAIRTVTDPDLGQIAMAGGLFRSQTGGARIAFTGRPPGSDTDAVLRHLGLDDVRIDELRADGVIA